MRFGATIAGCCGQCILGERRMSDKTLLALDGKLALVTGGSRGIGLQMAEGLGEMGARVIITARKQDELDEAQGYLRGLGIECITAAGDLADPASVTPMVDDLLAQH